MVVRKPSPVEPGSMDCAGSESGANLRSVFNYVNNKKKRSHQGEIKNPPKVRLAVLLEAGELCDPHCALDQKHQG